MKTIRTPLFLCVFLTVSALSMSACSMKDPTQAYGVRVELPHSVSGASTMNILNHSSMSSVSSISAPTSFGSFQCFGLNVLGDGIKSDPRFGCSDPSKGMGLVAGFVPVSGGVIDAKVPAGANRTIQLIGVQSEIGCPLLADLLAAQDPNNPDGFPGMGEPYLLGSVTTDVFTDVTVGITATFDANKKMFQGCDSSPSQKLKINVVNDEPNIQLSQCVPMTIRAEGSTAASFPSVLPTVLSGPVQLFSDSTCYYSLSNYISFQNEGMQPAFYMKTAPGAVLGDTFTLKLNTTATGWITDPVTFTVVSDRLQVNFPGTYTSLLPTTNLDSGCRQVEFQKFVGNTPGNLTALQNYIFNVFNGINYNLASPVKFYTKQSSCNSQNNADLITPTTVSGGKQTYTLNFTGASQIYMRSDVAAKVGMTISADDHSAQPGAGGMGFVPFVFNTMTPVSIYSGLSGGAAAGFTLSFEDSSGITDVIVGESSCGGFDNKYQTTNEVVCGVAPAQTSPGQYFIFVQKGGVKYPINLSVNYGSAPVINAGQSFTFTYGSAAPNSYITGAQMGPPTYCSIYPALPSGMYMNSGNCYIYGTPYTLVSPAANYTVTATSVFGTDSKVIQIQVNSP